MLRVGQIRTVEGVWIGEHRGRLVKRDAMLAQIRGGFACVRLEHRY